MALQNRAISLVNGDVHEASRSVSHNPTNSQWPASCSTMRANLPQQEHSSSCIEGKPFRHAKSRAKRDPPSQRCSSLDRVRPSHRTCAFLLISPRRHQTTVHLWGVACSPETQERGASRLLGVFCLFVVIVVVVIKTHFFLASL